MSPFLKFAVILACVSQVSDFLALATGIRPNELIPPDYAWFWIPGVICWLVVAVEVFKLKGR